MTITYKITARITGLLLLVQFIFGFLVNEVLLGPVTFAKDYLTAVAANGHQVVIAMLLNIACAFISIVVGAWLFPFFKKYNPVPAILFLAFSLLDFVNVAIDNSAVASLLALSKQYASSGGHAADYFQNAGTIAYATRKWTHLASILIACTSFSVFYYLLWAYNLVPRFISIGGVIGIVLMAVALLLMIFDKPASMLLLIPFGLNQLFLIGWLLVKGFNTHSVAGRLLPVQELNHLI